MTVNGHEKGWAEIRRSAMEAEGLHLKLNAAADGEPDGTRDLHELRQEHVDDAISMFGAVAAAAARYARERPHDENPSIGIWARLAERIVASLPTRLLRLWELHYVEGHPLAVYAESTGLGTAAAHADYVEIRRAIVRVFRAGANEELSSSGVRRTVVCDEGTSLPA